MPPRADVGVRLSPEGQRAVVLAFEQMLASANKASHGAEAGFLKLGKSLGTVNELLVKLGLAAGVVEGAVKLKEFALESIRLATAIRSLQLELGGATAGSASLAVAAQVTETDIGALRNTFTEFGRRLSDFIAGGGKAANSLRALGLSADDFKGKGLGDAFVVVAQRLANVQAGFQRTTAVADIFGKRAAALLPLIQLVGSAGFARVREQLDQLFDAQSLASIDEMRTSFGLLRAQTQGLAVAFSAGLAPAVTQAIADVSKQLGETSVDGFKRWGQQVGAVIGQLIIVFSDFADIVATGTKEIGLHLQAAGDIIAAAAQHQAIGAGVILEAANLRVKVLEDEYAKRRKQRESDLAALQSGKFATAEVFDTGGIEIEVPAAIAKRLDEARKAVAQELALIQANLKEQDARQRAALEQSLISLRTYYSERRRLQQAALDAEIHALERRRQAELDAAGGPELRAAVSKAAAELQDLQQQKAVVSSVAQDSASQAALERLDAQIAQKQNQLAAARAGAADISATQATAAAAAIREIDNQIAVKRAESHAATITLDAEEANALRQIGRERTDIEIKFQKLRGQGHTAAILELEQEVQKASEVFTRAAASRAAVIAGPEAPTSSADSAFTASLATAASALADFRAERARIDSQVQTGILNEAAGQRAIVQLEAQRLPLLVAAAATAQELALAAGRTTSEDTADALANQIRLEGIRATLRAQLEFSDARRVAEDELTRFETERGVIEERRSAGLQSRASAEREILKLITDELPILRELADRQLAAAKRADPQNEQGLLKQAEAFKRSVDQIGEAAQAIEDIGARIKAAFGDVLEQSLADFFDTGISKAKSFGDALKSLALSVADSMRQILSSILATKLVESLGFSIGKKKSGGIVGKASGGLIVGPGTGTSDSIPALSPGGLLRVSNHEFIMNAGSTAAPGMLAFLHRANRGDRSVLSFVASMMHGSSTPAVAASRAGHGFAAGGLATVEGGGTVGLGTLDVNLGLDRGLILETMASSEGARVQVRNVRRTPRAHRDALGR